MKIKVSNFISKYLVEHGINTTFMVTGGGAMHLDDAFGHEKDMKCIYNHHEQACSMAAEGYYRYSGKMASVLVTSGPGGTNAITGVMGAYLDSIPMIVFSGQVKFETTIHSCEELHLRQLGDQEFDITASVKNMTKYAVFVKDKNEILYHLEKALFFAMNGRRGPVWLDIPLDVQGAEIDDSSLKHFEPEKEKIGFIDKEIDKKVFEAILRKIYSAKAPLIIAGTAIRYANAYKDFIKLVNKLKIPVVTEWNANDTLPYDSKYLVGMPSIFGTRSGNFAVQNSDLLLVLGSRLNIRMIGYNKFDFGKNAYKIVVDIDEKELNKPTIKVDYKVNADLKTFLTGINEVEYEINPIHEKFLNFCIDVKNKYPVVQEKFRKDKSKLNPYVFFDKLYDYLNSNDRIVCANGSCCVSNLQAAKIKEGQRMFVNSGCASMGYGLPAAIGVATFDNSFRTIHLDGDGSIMMNLQEFATVRGNNLNIKTFIVNNNGYLSIRQTQRNNFKPPFIGIDKDSGVWFPDFKKLADAFSIRYECIRTEEEFDKKIKSILYGAEPIIVEVFVDPDQNFEPKSASKVLPDGSIISPTIDDMAPFLSKEEYESNHYKI